MNLFCNILICVSVGSFVYPFWNLWASLDDHVNDAYFWRVLIMWYCRYGHTRSLTLAVSYHCTKYQLCIVPHPGLLLSNIGVRVVVAMVHTRAVPLTTLAFLSDSRAPVSHSHVVTFSRGHFASTLSLQSMGPMLISPVWPRVVSSAVCTRKL